MTEFAEFKTGIDVFDSQIGGLPSGLIFLLEEVGAGGREFALTTLMKLAKSGFENLYYFAISSTVDEIKRELTLTFPKSGNEWIDKIDIKSFSKDFFAKTVVPLSWLDVEVGLSALKKGDLLRNLFDGFEKVGDNSVLLIDSFIDLVRKTDVLGGNELSWRDLVDFVTGLRKFIIKKNMLVYCLMTKDVVGKAKEEELISSSDGVIVFEFLHGKEMVKRSMFIRKLLGALPILERRGIMRFDISFDPSEGFIISRLQRIV
ncbi:hypothetical protein Asulf_02159 [Archaeoglobus sulfaticallidus PM70-1]|uniref:RecA-superfamily ATPases implicated in signal transduction n=1 Tax=Archaeoglobus sulfaticallidus PM70-1 TaxID=387631 RepID=N0BGI5_9EURY|nr:hypothetical protein [Archaeoglobus sulfaticallidus]AGK62113.1 hypothetical protein Asulf_02159 [Archaeoglobus sulfaticallidus PM70-1]